MALTGDASGPAQVLPLPLASYADGVLGALSSLHPASHLERLDGPALLAERAALAGFRRAGSISAGGGCHLLSAADGFLAVNLARDADWEMLPAWLEAGAIKDWHGLARALRKRSAAQCVDRGRLIGLAVAPEASPSGAPLTPWYREIYRSERRRTPGASAPLVVDLSSLWAGPLASHLLQSLGARVIKVESSARPDGMRSGGTHFYDLLNAGKASVALDFERPRGRAQLRELLLRADIVIEGSRPRALRQLGILAEEIVEESATTWVAISGYGREEPAANWVAFGDDAGVAAGLSRILRECTGVPMFCADAIADPLTGLHAALAAWSSFASGGGRLLSLALSDVVTHCIQFGGPLDAAALKERAAKWRRCITPEEVAAPRARPLPARSARPLGADTISILSGLGVAC